MRNLENIESRIELLQAIYIACREKSVIIRRVLHTTSKYKKVLLFASGCISLITAAVSAQNANIIPADIKSIIAIIGSTLAGCITIGVQIFFVENRPKELLDAYAKYTDIAGDCGTEMYRQYAKANEIDNDAAVKNCLDIYHRYFIAKSVYDSQFVEFDNVDTRTNFIKTLDRQMNSIVEP